MKASSAVFTSIIIFIISGVIIFLKPITGCLASLLSYVGIIAGIILLIVGLVKHLRAKGLSDEDRRRRNLVLVSGSSLLEPFHSLADAVVRIFRNPRRTLAMLSGIILGTLIISSIFIYTNVLQNEMYESMVKGIPYEVSFQLEEEGNETLLEEYAHEIEKDPRVESATVFTGGTPGGNGYYTEGGGPVFWEDPDFRLIARIDGDTLIQTMERWEDEAAVVNPVFIDDDFSSTTIYDKLIGDRLEGDFDLSGPSNRSVIPRSMALRMNLEVGTVIPGINVTLLSYVSYETNEFRFQNVTVTGIYEDVGSSWDEEMTAETIIFSTGMLDSNSTLMVKFREYKLFTLAVKIEKDEFNTGNLEAMSGQIDRLVNDVTRGSGDDLKGSNNVDFILRISSFIRYAIIIIDVVLIVPVVVLTIYLLIYGLELSLEERRKEIGILKVQGADGKQIFGQVMTESFILLFLGLALGYLLAIVGAWIISSAVGFMNFNFSYDYLSDFLFFDMTAFLISLLAIGLITLISIRKRGRSFIDLQVSEAVQTLKWKKKGFLRRHNIDLVLFIFGVISASKTILDKAFGIDEIAGYKLSLGSGWDTFLFGFIGTVALWVGGAFSAPVIAKWVALKLEKVMLKVKLFRDIGPVIKSGLKRRGEVAKLVFIIALTLSIASLAVIQGYSDERFSVRELEYQIGADFQLTFSNGTDHTVQILNVDGVDEAMSLPSVTVEILSSSVTLYGIDAENASFAQWHANSFRDETPRSALRKLAGDNALPGVYLGSSFASDIGARNGDILTLKVARLDPVSGNITMERLDVRVLGRFDHVPGAIGKDAMLADHSTLLTIRQLMRNHDLRVSGDVRILSSGIGPEQLFADHSLDGAMAGGMFVFNITVDDTAGITSVYVNWSHGEEGGNESLFPVGRTWMGLAEPGQGTSDLTYRIYLTDIYNNTNTSGLQRVDVGNIWHPAHILDLSPPTALPGGRYSFNLSLGESLRYGTVRATWSQGGRNGELILDDGSTGSSGGVGSAGSGGFGFYTGTITLDDTALPLTYNITVDNQIADLGSTKYLVGVSKGSSNSRMRDRLEVLDGVTNVANLEKEIDNIGNQNNWGIPGLLTMMFIASLIAALTISFTFSSIIMKKRQREFAVLQTIGASRGQVYKIAISENSVLMMISVILGITIGIGLSYLMNGFFGIIGELLGRGILDRLVFIPWFQLILIGVATFIGMLLAVALSAISAARQDLSVSTRVI